MPPPSPPPLSPPGDDGRRVRFRVRARSPSPPSGRPDDDDRESTSTGESSSDWSSPTSIRADVSALLALCDHAQSKSARDDCGSFKKAHRLPYARSRSDGTGTRSPSPDAGDGSREEESHSHRPPYARSASHGTARTPGPSCPSPASPLGERSTRSGISLDDPLWADEDASASPFDDRGARGEGDPTCRRLIYSLTATGGKGLSRGGSRRQGKSYHPLRACDEWVDRERRPMPGQRPRGDRQWDERSLGLTVHTQESAASERLRKNTTDIRRMCKDILRDRTDACGGGSACAPVDGGAVVSYEPSSAESSTTSIDPPEGDGRRGSMCSSMAVVPYEGSSDDDDDAGGSVASDRDDAGSTVALASRYEPWYGPSCRERSAPRSDTPQPFASFRRAHALAARPGASVSRRPASGAAPEASLAAWRRPRAHSLKCRNPIWEEEGADGIAVRAVDPPGAFGTCAMFL